MDFYSICTREIENGSKKGTMELYPDFKVVRSKDLMVRAKNFYAIWDEEAGLWSQDEYDVQRLVDADLRQTAERLKADTGISYSVKYLSSASSGVWYQFRKYMQNISDNSHQLDENLTFANTPVVKEDYVSKRLPYAIEDGDHSAYDELIGTLYNVEERAKIEWALGAIIAGDAKKIQKFMVLYGPPGWGKGTIINIALKLFPGYYTTFEAKSLGSSNAAFATEVFKGNPLVGIQHDGDLSKIEDNSKLNSIISHEEMTMNEKFKPSYTARVNAFLIMGTNKPVKISDAKSGIIRRLIDVHPTGVTLPNNHYLSLMARTDFELGAIAQHCLNVYREMGKQYYNSYRPTEMMLQTDVFFNFIEFNYDIFKAQDGMSLQQAYALYKEFCSATGIEHVLPQYKVREELRSYFDEFKDRVTIDGKSMRSYYSGFNAQKFKVQDKPDAPWKLDLSETVSLLDARYSEMPAQYGTSAETPKRKWEVVKTTLSDIDTSQLHFVQIPKQDIVIDFDLKDEHGNKSLERNLEAASAWPTTYAELSKGGQGVHLHYEYDGDVEELAPVFSEGIEVKTLLGNSSLRRKLTKCNNVPVARMVNSLPIKEKKVLDVNQIQSERGLRNLIARAMNKEFNGATKPSVDFIKKILDEAYDDGLSYDVTDLESKLVTFASKSSNQSLLCLKLVREMKLRGKEDEKELDEQSDSGLVEDVEIKDSRLVFYDVEVYPNLFVVCYKIQGSDTVVRMINPSVQDIEGLMSRRLVGFYNRRYDNHILYAAFMGYDNAALFKLSQAIVTENRYDKMFVEAYGLSYADIWDFSSIKQSLKKFQVELGLKHVELDIPWDQPVPEELWDKVVEYCVNDVISTEKVFEDRAQDFIARRILADLSGLTVNDTTAKHTARIIFGNDRNPQEKFVYTHLEEMFEGYKYDMGKSTYRGELVGEGGYVYAEPGMYENVVELDIASMHPTSIEQLNLFGEYTPRFSALKDARIAIKHGDYDSARQMLDGKLAPYLKDEKDAKQLAYALKIVINIVYGLTSAKFDTPFRDKRNKDNIVAKRGALFMIDLKLACQEKNLKVVHIKTDSIKIPNASQEDIDEIMAFGSKYGYTFELDAVYDKFCLVNDAVYIAKKNDGSWNAVGAQFQHPYVFKTLFSHEDVTFEDLNEFKQVQKGGMYLDFEHDTPNPVVERMQYVGKSGRFVPVHQGSGGAVLYRVVDGKPYAATGTKGHLWLEADHAKSLGDKIDVDMTYFDGLIDKAYKTIEKYGDFQKFVE